MLSKFCHLRKTPHPCPNYAYGFGGAKTKAHWLAVEKQFHCFSILAPQGERAFHLAQDKHFQSIQDLWGRREETPSAVKTSHIRREKAKGRFTAAFHIA
jgi:hypothetical protein